MRVSCEAWYGVSLWPLSRSRIVDQLLACSVVTTFSFTLLNISATFPHFQQQQQHVGWHLHLDAAHMGVGGDDRWSPSVHDEYLLAAGKYHLGLMMRAVGVRERGPGLFGAAKQLHRSAAAPASTLVS